MAQTKNLIRPAEEDIAVVNAYAGDVYRLALAVTKNQQDAEDIMQDVFLRYFKKRPPFESAERTKNWLLCVASRRCKSLFGLAHRRHNVPLEEAETLAGNHISNDNAVLGAVLALPEKQRLCLHMHYYEDLPVMKIAELTNMNVSTVKSHLRRGRLTLENKLKNL